SPHRDRQAQRRPAGARRSRPSCRSPERDIDPPSGHMRYPGSISVALSYVVRARMREIGVRPALGATPSVMLSNTLLRGVTPAIAGVDSSVSASRRHGVFRALLFDVQPP